MPGNLFCYGLEHKIQFYMKKKPYFLHFNILLELIFYFSNQKRDFLLLIKIKYM